MGLGKYVDAKYVAGLALAAGVLASQIGVVATQSSQTTTQSGQVVTPTIQTQQQQKPPEPPKGTGLLLGQVVDASTKAPIASAIVSLTGGPVLPPGTPPPPPVVGGGRQVLADSAGRFVFHSLPAGRYTVRATAQSYTSGSFGAMRPTGSAQAIELTRDDEKRDGIVVRMWKSASITGTVLDEVGEPVVGFYVQVFSRSAMLGGRARWLSGQSGRTDDRGMFRIADLAPGEYVLGAISATTTMPAAVADAFRQEIESGVGSLNGPVSRALSSSGLFLSAALSGSYRVGDYIVQTGMSVEYGPTSSLPPPPPDAGKRMMVYATQFYPAAPSVAQATILTLASGEERRGIELRLRLVPAVRVSGLVIGPDGPVANLALKLFPPGADDFYFEGMESATTATDAAGMFTFFGVTPGQYTLRAIRVPRPLPTPRQPSNSIEVMGPGGGLIMGMSGGPSGTLPPPPPLPTEPTLYFIQPLTIGEADINGISIALRSGARLGGRIVFEGGDMPSPDDVQRTSLQITPLAGSTNSPVAGAAKRVGPDGQFATVGIPPGRYTLNAFFPQQAPSGSPWRYKSTTLAGRDVSDEGFELAGDDLTTLAVIFTKQPPNEINGTVKNDKGEPDQTASVVILPSDSDGWRRGFISTRRIRTARVGTSGAFRLTDVPPGTYFIAAVSDTQLDNYQTPAVLGAISRVAVQVTVGESGSVTQALTTRTIR